MQSNKCADMGWAVGRRIYEKEEIEVFDLDFFLNTFFSSQLSRLIMTWHDTFFDQSESPNFVKSWKKCQKKYTQRINFVKFDG